MHADSAKASAARVLDVIRLTPAHFRIDIESEHVSAASIPGQFVMVRPLPAVTDPLLGRPLAVLGRDTAASSFSLLFTPAGRGTRILAEAAPGDTVHVNGPLGTGFDFSAFDEIALIGGGTGIAPLYFLAAEARAAGKTVHLVLGARTCDSLPFTGSFSPDERFHCATDDGSRGFHGSAVDAFFHLVADRIASNRRPVGLFAAGPVPMMKALVSATREMGISLQVSLEARMACGIGVCRGCVIPARTPHPLYGHLTRAVCADGPVFDASVIDWERLPDV
ncbi:MAG: dihydroorotate dehydrogenase electron transfer subunit [Planctomycetes bacterium]|nr:dihydroorotate dehydrogenase electron transfer subunit [Planctomycetota bacterium]